MEKEGKNKKQLFEEIEELRIRLEESAETLSAIRSGEVDAIVVSGPLGDQVFTLTGAERAYRVLIEEMNEGAVVLSADGTILYCNRRFAELVSVPLEQIVGSNFTRFVAESDKPKYDILLHAGLKGKSNGEITCLIHDGNPVHLYLSFSPLPPDMSGDVCIMASDITELKQKEEELRHAHDTLEQQVAERTATLTKTIGELAASRLAAINMMEDAVEAKKTLESAHKELLEQINERKRAEKEIAANALRTQLLLDLHPLSSASREEILDFALEASLKTTQSEFAWFGFMDETESVLTIHRWSNNAMAQCALDVKPFVFQVSEAGLWGDCIWQRKPVLVNDYSAPHTSKTGIPEGYIPIQRFLAVPAFDGTRIVAVAAVANKQGDYTDSDISALTNLINKLWGLLRRKRVDEALRESEEKYRTLVENIPQKIFTKDRRSVFVSCNENFARDMGITPEEIAGKTDYDFFPKELADKYRSDDMRIMETGETEGIEEQYILGDEKVWIYTVKTPLRDKEGNIVGILGVFSDITERKNLEARLLQAQKMETVGQLAGGIAHDFNNNLTAVIGYAYMLKMKIKDDEDLRDYANRILLLSDRAANLTKSLLAFSRKQLMNPMPVDLNEIIKRVDHLLSRIIGEDIKLQVVLLEEDLIVMADSGQIEQVLMNLATNARDAMPKGGLLTIGTETAYIDHKFIKEHGFGKEGRYALISFADTGIGMDRETREKIFEPFFTTKEVGKGTGLGLSMVYGIIKQHEGYINVYSEPGMGTTFRIYLPLIKAKVEEIKPEVIQPVERGTETILLAEDEIEVKEFTKKMLEEYGYKVITAGSGQKAIDEFKAHKDKIQLVLLDVIMPNKNGKEAYEEIKKIMPDIKVLFMSGYPADIIHKHDIIEKGFAYIEKPASPTKLLRKIREVLGK
jgi:PAS domain S-box-containing protein